MAELEDRRYQHEDEIVALVRGFADCTLPFARWTHEAHLTVALYFLATLPPEEATARIREGIQRYNLANGVVQTLTRGYHETITRFYIWAVRCYLAERWAAQPIASLLDLTNGLLDSRYGDRHFPLDYYTRDHLMSWDARTGWVAPDRKPLKSL
jgi:hypothetical protein